MKYQRTNSQIAIACADPLYQARSEHLAKQLQLPFVGPEQGHELVLQYSSQGLELCRSKMLLRVDFLAGPLAFRQKQQGKELLLRAVAGKSKEALHIVDATGGLGRDAFLLAAAGHEVLICEQQAVLAALLADGLDRALADPAGAAIASRMQLRVENALHLLHDIAPPEVIYLDPMFPERRKSASVKKEAQFLQELVPYKPTEDARLLEQARALARQRTVVKRPLAAEFLGQQQASFSLKGKTIRFDIYLSA